LLMATQYSEQSHMICSRNGPVTPRTINEQNRQFWSEQSKLMERRMSDGTISEIATTDVRLENERRLPLAWQKSFEQALAQAEITKGILHKNLSRMGRKARKGDPLQNLILSFVRENPDITERQLFHKLRSEHSAGIVTSIDRQFDLPPGHIAMIHFVVRSGVEKTAPLRGLKDRLFRAKGQISSRQPG